MKKKKMKKREELLTNFQTHEENLAGSWASHRQKASVWCFQMSNTTCPPPLAMSFGWNDPFVMASTALRAEPGVLIDLRDQMSRSEQLCGEVCARTVPQCRAGTRGLVAPTHPHPSKVVTWDNIAPGCTVCPPKMKQNASSMQAFIKKCLFDPWDNISMLVIS